MKETKNSNTSDIVPHELYSDLLTNEEIRTKANRSADYVRRLLKNNKTNGYEKAISYIENKRIVKPSGTKSAQMLRVVSDRWWFKKLLKKNKQEVEEYQRVRGFVSKDNSPYISNVSLQVDRQARANSEKSMKEQFLINKVTGERVSMFDIAQTTVSNPEVRRAELMCRLNGFEKLADESELIACFYTITAPSKFHRFSDKWKGQTTIDGNNYLKKLWNRVRNNWRNNDVHPVGFRITEPHAEGCPHWHVLLWMKQSEFETVTKIMKSQALKMDGKEAGAAANRFDIELMTEEKGSAVSYIAKYISKNIDGHGIEEDETAGIDAASGAERVRAWSSLYDVRQFNQIGGASVSVWRKLRSIEKQPAGLIENLRLAASENDFAKYMELQGGLNARSGNLKLISEKTGCKNDYGEDIFKAVELSDGTEVFELKESNWSVDNAPAFDCSSVAPWNLLNNCIKSADSVDTATLEPSEILGESEEYSVINSLIEAGVIDSVEAGKINTPSVKDINVIPDTDNYYAPYYEIEGRFYAGPYGKYSYFDAVSEHKEAIQAS